MWVCTPLVFFAVPVKIIRSCQVFSLYDLPGGTQFMNKSELIATIAESGGMTKVRAGEALDKVLAYMAEAMENGERVTISGFGSFRVVERAAQKGRNPQTGDSIIIPAHNVVKFKPGKNLCKRVAIEPGKWEADRETVRYSPEIAPPPAV